jgi:hypothetical protein
MCMLKVDRCLIPTLQATSGVALWVTIHLIGVQDVSYRTIQLAWNACEIAAPRGSHYCFRNLAQRAFCMSQFHGFVLRQHNNNAVMTFYGKSKQNNRKGLKFFFLLLLLHVLYILILARHGLNLKPGVAKIWHCSNLYNICIYAYIWGVVI